MYVWPHRTRLILFSAAILLIVQVAMHTASYTQFFADDPTLFSSKCQWLKNLGWPSEKAAVDCQRGKLYFQISIDDARPDRGKTAEEYTLDLGIITIWRWRAAISGTTYGADLRLWYSIGINVMLLVLFTHRRRRKQVPSINHCIECGYDLFKNTSGVCPECGSRLISQ